jgi:GNAT superfamily N-acetyltransferase
MGILGERIMPCPAVMRPAALEVLYRRMPSALRGHLIAEVLEDARKGDLDLSGLWVAQARSGRIVGAMMTQALAGKAAAVWPPEVKPSWRRAALAADLVQAALGELAARGYRLAQAALDESAGPQAARDLTRGGMPRVTELLYLERDTATPLPPRGTAFQDVNEDHGQDDRATGDHGQDARATSAQPRKTMAGSSDATLRNDSDAAPRQSACVPTYTRAASVGDTIIFMSSRARAGSNPNASARARA